MLRICKLPFAYLAYWLDLHHASRMRSRAWAKNREFNRRVVKPAKEVVSRESERVAWETLVATIHLPNWKPVEQELWQPVWRVYDKYFTAVNQWLEADRKTTQDYADAVARAKERLQRTTLHE